MASGDGEDAVIGKKTRNKKRLGRENEDHLVQFPTPIPMKQLFDSEVYLK